MPAKKTFSFRLPHDPDTLVFWLTSTLCALFLLFVPGMIPAL
ncbi:MAG: hypothetical protein NT159_04650 [Proteobacteria bacterium]|nr:hypothetical protein [Pseudomonadota bacterium]